MAPGSHAFSQRLSFGYFSLARQRKVTAAPRRGNAKTPTTSQAIYETARQPPTQNNQPRTTQKNQKNRFRQNPSQFCKTPPPPVT
jgi:hypothetical protein